MIAIFTQFTYVSDTANIVATRLIVAVDVAVVEVHVPGVGRVIGIRCRRPIKRGETIKHRINC